MGFLEAAIAQKPADVEALIAIGGLRMRDDPAAAASHWRKFRDLNPKDVRGPLFEARAELAAGRDEAAVRALDAAEALADTSPAPEQWEFEIAFDRARVAFRRRDLDGARRSIQDLILSSSEAAKIERAEKFLARIDASRSALP